MHIRRISVAKYPYPYPFKQGNYYPYPIRIRENCGYPQNIYPRIHIRASLELMSYCCRYKRRFRSQIANFSNPIFLRPAEGVPFEFCNDGMASQN